MRLEILADDAQHARPVRLPGERDAEVPDVQLEETRQQFGVVDVGAVGGVAVPAGTGVHADALALLRREPREREVVERDEAVEQRAARVELHREARLGEVDLHAMGAEREAAPHLADMLGEQIIDEPLAGITGDLVGRVHETQRGGRDDRLLERTLGISLRRREELVAAHAIAKGAPGETRHAAHMARREGDAEPVRRGVGEPVDAVGPEVVILPLLAIGDDGGAGGLERHDGLADRLLVQGIESRIGVIAAIGDRLE